MLEWIKDVGIIIASILGAVFVFVPQFRAQRPWVVALVGAIIAGSVTLGEYYLKSTTGRGLQDRAACLIFPNGAACKTKHEATGEPTATSSPQTSSPLPAERERVVDRVSGTDDYIITDVMANLPSEAMAEPFAGMDGEITYCNGFTILNASKRRIDLSICEPESDNCSTLAGVNVGERRHIGPGDLNSGHWIIFDDEKRFQFSVAIEDKC